MDNADPAFDGNVVKTEISEHRLNLRSFGRAAVDLPCPAFAHFDGNAIAVVPQCVELPFETFPAGPRRRQRIDIEFD